MKYRLEVSKVDYLVIYSRQDKVDLWTQFDHLSNDPEVSVPLQICVQDWELNYSQRAVDFPLHNELESILPILLARK